MAFLGGASGSLIAQILSVPIDVISQHMMLAGQKGAVSSTRATTNNNPAALSSTSVNAGKIGANNVRELDRIHIPDNLKSASSFRIVKYISQEIFKNENLKGFYRGYLLSTFLVSLNSALWWPFYYFYQGETRISILSRSMLFLTEY